MEEGDGRAEEGKDRSGQPQGRRSTTQIWMVLYSQTSLSSIQSFGRVANIRLARESENKGKKSRLFLSPHSPVDCQLLAACLP